jgi:hypothetical protein
MELSDTSDTLVTPVLGVGVTSSNPRLGRVRALLVTPVTPNSCNSNNEDTTYSRAIYGYPHRERGGEHTRKFPRKVLGRFWKRCHLLLEALTAVGLRAFSLKNEVSPKVSPFGISSLAPAVPIPGLGTSGTSERRLPHANG